MTSESVSRRPRARRWLKEGAWIVGTIVLVLVSGLWIGAFRAPDIVGEAPEFSLLDLSGQRVRLSDFRGRTVVLSFWATWCPPCRIELPTLARFARNHPEIQMLGLSVQSPPDDLERVAADLPYPVLILDDETGRRLGIGTLPSTWVVGPDGRVTAAHSGLLFGPQLWWLTR